MSCRLLWNSSTHFLYRCNHTITCEAIDKKLYICTSLRKQNAEQNRTEIKSQEGDTVNNTTSSKEENEPSHINTPNIVSTTGQYPYQTTSQNPSPVSNNPQQFPLQTTTLILNLRTTTGIPIQNLQTDPVSYTTTKIYNISTTETKKLSHISPSQTSFVPVIIFSLKLNAI